MFVNSFITSGQSCQFSNPNPTLPTRPNKPVQSRSANPATFASQIPVIINDLNKYVGLCFNYEFTQMIK